MDIIHPTQRYYACRQRTSFMFCVTPLPLPCVLERSSLFRVWLEINPLVRCAAVKSNSVFLYYKAYTSTLYKLAH